MNFNSMLPHGLSHDVPGLLHHHLDDLVLSQARVATHNLLDAGSDVIFNLAGHSADYLGLLTLDTGKDGLKIFSVKS